MLEGISIRWKGEGERTIQSANDGGSPIAKKRTFEFTFQALRFEEAF